MNCFGEWFVAHERSIRMLTTTIFAMTAGLHAARGAYVIGLLFAAASVCSLVAAITTPCTTLRACHAVSALVARRAGRE